jgi:PPM family protein phosphatase
MHSPGKNVVLRSSARTDKGLVRENNEDNIQLWMEDNVAVAIVADGMGGAAAGEEASRLAVEAVQDTMIEKAPKAALESFDNMGDDIIAQRMRDIIQVANLNIMNRASTDPGLRGMGTTVTLAFVRNMHVIVAHVGDSRAYLVSQRDHAISQITADHSFVEALRAAGHITEEQAEVHPLGHILYRALGQTADVDVDLYHSRLRPGDRLVLCSDGLTRHVRPHEIAEVALSDDNPEVICEKLVSLTNSRGGEDNVSVIVLVLEGNMLSSLEGADVNDTIVLRDEEESTRLKAHLESKRTVDPEATVKTSLAPHDGKEEDGQDDRTPE